jgi:hypothetical protein
VRHDILVVIRRMQARQPMIFAWLFVTQLVNCAATSSEPSVPRFLGHETESWLVQETAPVGRNDVLPAFEARARDYGCSTEWLELDERRNIHGQLRSYYGVSASCEEGIIALVTIVGGGVRIGCAKPTTREACDLLLRNIARGR